MYCDCALGNQNNEFHLKLCEMLCRAHTEGEIVSQGGADTIVPMIFCREVSDKSTVEICINTRYNFVEKRANKFMIS